MIDVDYQSGIKYVKWIGILEGVFDNEYWQLVFVDCFFTITFSDCLWQLFATIIIENVELFAQSPPCLDGLSVKVPNMNSTPLGPGWKRESRRRSRKSRKRRNGSRNSRRKSSTPMSPKWNLQWKSLMCHSPRGLASSYCLLQSQFNY